MFATFYAQAKMGLTWQDIKRIVEIAHDLEPLRGCEDFLFEFQSEESFYQEILKRFKEKRNGQH